MIRLVFNPKRHAASAQVQALLFVLIVAIIGASVIYLSRAATSTPAGDLNNDGAINITDLSILLSNLNSSSTTYDLSSPPDGVVDIIDLSVLLTNFNKPATSTNPPPNFGTALPSPLPESSGTKITANNSSLSSQIAALKPGDTLCLPGGVIYGQGSTADVNISINGTSANPITIETCSGSTARAEIAQRINIYGSYVRLRNLKITKNLAGTDTRHNGDGTACAWAQSGGLPGGNVNVWFQGATHVTLEKSEITGGTMSGIFGTGSYNQILANYSHDNGTTPDDHGIYYAGSNSVIANNVFYNNFGYGVQIAYTNAIGNIIANNTSVHNGFGSATCYPDSGYVTFSGAKTNLFVNNIAYSNAKYGFETYDSPSNGNSMKNNNSFLNQQGNLSTQTTSAGFATNAQYTNLDPKFASGSDFHLQTSSPMAGIGDATYTPITDFYGLTRSTADLGAIGH